MFTESHFHLIAAFFYPLILIMTYYTT